MDEWYDIDDLIDKSEDLIELGLFDEARALLDKYEYIYADEWELYVMYAHILTDQNKPAEALPYLHKGLSIDKSNADCLLGLFYAHTMMHHIKKGGKYLLRAKKLHPDNELVLTSLIWYYTETNEISSAINYFERLLHEGVTNPETFRNGALAYQRGGFFENAEECFKRALELNPQYEEVRDMLADHYLFLEQESRAIALYQDALLNSPQNIRLISRLIYCQTQASQHEQAEKLARESITLYPNSPIGYVDLAYVFLNNNGPKKAIEFADQAHDISPLDAEAFRIKGIAYSELSEWELGTAAFESAISIDPENTEIIRDYYHHLRAAGKHPEMEEWVQRAITIEEPYCLEEYCFLADFYREADESLKAFHYLHKAYKSVPPENELIPPMVDILLERGHTAYSIPFLMGYVKQSGWNDIMSEFARHKRLRGKWSQEGLRFLRFQGQRTSDYRRFVFIQSMERFTLLAVTIIIALSLLPLSFLFGTRGILVPSIGYVFSLLTYITVRHFARKRSLNVKKIPF